MDLRNQVLSVQNQRPIEVKYDGLTLGEYFADLVVEVPIIIEVKSLPSPIEERHVQLANSLKATGREMGLLINFGRSVEIKAQIPPPKTLMIIL